MEDNKVRNLFLSGGGSLINQLNYYHKTVSLDGTYKSVYLPYSDSRHRIYRDNKRQSQTTPVRLSQSRWPPEYQTI